VIDWSLPGKSIFDRSKPLADATLRRIEIGVDRYWGSAAKPFLLKFRGTGTVGSIHDPLSTVTSSGMHHGLVLPIDNRSQEGGARPVRDPGSTITTKQRHALVVGYYGNGVSEPVDRPVPTVTTKDRFGLAVANGLDITLRMLTPRELALAQSFPASYQFSGTKTEQVKQIGNAVPPLLSYAQTLDYANGN